MKLFWDNAESKSSALSIPEHKYTMMMMTIKMIMMMTVNADAVTDDDDNEDDNDNDVNDNDDDDSDLCEGSTLPLPPDCPAESCKNHSSSDHQENSTLDWIISIECNINIDININIIGVFKSTPPPSPKKK